MQLSFLKNLPLPQQAARGMGPTHHGTVTGRVIIYRRPPESPAMTTHRPPTTVRLIGVPTDIGASVRGASMGPEAMRVAGLQQAL